MKKTIFYIIPILFLLVISCAKQPKERVLTIKDVFPTQKNTDSTFVFDLDTITTFDKYHEKCEYYKKVTSKNQYIRTQNYDIPLNINFFIKCHLPTFCPKERNTIIIEGNFKQDLTYFSDTELLEVHSFGKFLKKQFLNRGKNLEYADSPDRSIILLRYRDLTDKSKNRLNSVLDTISVSYFNFIRSFKNDNIDSLKSVYPLQILLEKDFRQFDENGNLIHLPPPPQPAPIEIVE